MTESQTIYAVYDSLDNDIIVFIGPIDKLTKEFNITYSAVYKSISKNRLLYKRYKIKKTGSCKRNKMWLE